MHTIKPLSADLIAELAELYPVVLPRPATSVDREKELFAAGQRSVIDFLLDLQKEMEPTFHK